MSGVQFKTTTAIDSAKIQKRIQEREKKIVPYLTAMVLADSNYFVPKDTSMLEKSAIINTEQNKGIIRWTADYAHAQYYGENFDHSQQKNPNACARWFEAAKARWQEKWVRFVNDLYKRG